MQPRYDIQWSEEFAADVTEIWTLEIFKEAFRGFDALLRWLPRDQATWDVSPAGDVRLAHLLGPRLDDGTVLPDIFFVYQLHLGSTCYVELLRAYSEHDPALHGISAGAFARE